MSFRILTPYVSPEETFCTLYPFSVACAGIFELITKCKQCFCLRGELSQRQFLSRHLHRSLLCSTHRSRCLCFSIFVLYFSSVSIFYHRTIWTEQKENIQIIREILNDKFIRHKYIVNGAYAVNDNRLGFFVSEKQTRKMTAGFHKVKPVKPFTDCLTRCHAIY